MNLFWYKYGDTWKVTFHKSYIQFGPHKYSGPKQWLKNAEVQMSANPSTDVLSFKLEAQARNLIWC